MLWICNAAAEPSTSEMQVVYSSLSFHSGSQT
jgi:hypothetical protein